MLPRPTKDELPQQAAAFLRMMFRAGESFECVFQAGTKANGKKYPLRSADQIVTLPDDSEEASPDSIEKSVQCCTGGAWVSLNPVSCDIKGKAPTDNEVTDCRYALVEADNLSQD